MSLLRPSAFAFSSAALLALFAATACSSETSEEEDDSAALEDQSVCRMQATHPNAAMARMFAGYDGTVGNFGVWPSPNGARPELATDAEGARRLLASKFAGCAEPMAQHMKTGKPNVYVYFTGYGGPQQDNSHVDEPAIMKWINERDPRGIIFSISWNCAGAGDDFCKLNARSLSPKETSPEYLAFERSVRVIQGPDETLKTMATVKDLVRQQGEGYDAALSHAMQLGAKLIDQVLLADQGENGKELFGNIHLLGYSMGAHAASDILVQDFTSDATTGYKWTRSGVCDNGAEVCTVADLKKVKWALGLGTPGWAEGMKAHAQARGADYETYKNGGLLRISDPRFKRKLTVFNRRMDPTSTSDDTFQRAFGDILYGDYNHYSHDYSLPMFIQPGFVQALDAFLEAPDAKSSQELGILYDNGALVDFDECKAGAPCAARNYYLAHAQNRSHGKITIMSTGAVQTVEGVKRADRKANRAVSFTAQGAAPVVVPSMDQEDLRGAVELYYRPTAYDPGAPGKDFGLFSYGKCAANDTSDELMPVAYVSADGNVVFSVSYQGARYEARVATSKAQLAKNKWTHLAFSWELPVESLTKPSNSDDELRAQLPAMGADLQKHKAALIWANGLRKPLATTYNRQKGQGTLRIHANGALVAEAPLGTSASSRDCLSMVDVLPGASYETGSDGTYPAYLPYANVVASAQSDIVKVNESPVGTRCKAYKVRNVPVVFGCAHAAGNAPNAGGDMDELVLVYGKGREKFENVSASGEPKNWPIGATYGAERFKAR